MISAIIISFVTVWITNPTVYFTGAGVLPLHEHLINPCPPILEVLLAASLSDIVLKPSHSLKASSSPRSSFVPAHFVNQIPFKRSYFARLLLFPLSFLYMILCFFIHSSNSEGIRSTSKKDKTPCLLTKSLNSLKFRCHSSQLSWFLLFA